MKKSRRPRLETLEARAVLNVGPIDLLSLSESRAAWTLSDDDGSATVDIVVDGDSSRWTPELYGDFTSDGVDDVLGRLDNGDWWLQVNDGTKLYNVPWNQLGGAPVDAEIIGSAQMTDDTQLDVVLLDPSNGDVWVSFNTGRGLLSQRWARLGEAPREAFLGDFNGDGRTDLLTVDADDNFRLARNDGGAFVVEDWGRMPFFNWVDVMSGDFNGDGTDDLTARAPDNTWWTWFGSDTGMQAGQFWGHWRMRTEWHDVSTADFNNDGMDDLIGRTEDGRLWVGTATDTRFHTWTWNEGWVNRAEWSNVTHVDINDDGLVDQVGMAKDNSWYYAMNTGEARFHNFFWQNMDPGEFHYLATNFQTETAVDVTVAMPTGGVDIPGSEVFANLNDDGKIELTTNQTGINLIGVEFESDSGSLIPLSQEADPFDLALAVTESVVSLGNLGSGVSLDDGLVFEIGWTDGANDLSVRYGVDANLQSAVVFEPLGRAPMPTEDTQEEYNMIYYQTLPEGRAQFPDA